MYASVSGLGISLEYYLYSIGILSDYHRMGDSHAYISRSCSKLPNRLHLWLKMTTKPASDDHFLWPTKD